MTRGCLEAVLIQRVLDEPGLWCSDALIDRERLAVKLAGLLGCRRPGSQLAEVRTGRAKSRKASGTAGERPGGARQAGGQNVWNWLPGRRAHQQRRSEARGCSLTGPMSAWQCDGLRHDGFLERADVRDGPLIAQSLRGTPEAFVEIVRRHEVAIHGYLTRRAGQRAADDLLGEVWVRAFGARDGYDPSYEDARPWLYGIARNVLRAHWRTGQNVELALPEEVLDPWDEITDRLDSAVRVRALVSALGKLPSTERDVLLLVAWEQLTPAEAAITLSIPPGTARSRLHRARTTLRQILAEPADGTEVRK